ncbi:hypothetical protein QYF36_023576 [Acer negundo]|nr:hypothetical protein QYF36_023576 [Acer negundo]
MTSFWNDLLLKINNAHTKSINVDCDVNHTEAGLLGGVLDECFSPIPNIEIKKADLTVESIGKKQ